MRDQSDGKFGFFSSTTTTKVKRYKMSSWILGNRDSLVLLFTLSELVQAPVSLPIDDVASQRVLVCDTVVYPRFATSRDAQKRGWSIEHV